MGFIYGKAFEPPSPNPFVENVAAFVAFLRESGRLLILVKLKPWRM
jgi:hypothetical protein